MRLTYDTGPAGRRQHRRSPEEAVGQPIPRTRPAGFHASFHLGHLVARSGTILLDCGAAPDLQGADLAFLWKPKLRIPDLYENPGNQRAFRHFPDACACCASDEHLVAAIRRPDQHAIKGSALLPPTCRTFCTRDMPRRSIRRSSTGTTHRFKGDLTPSRYLGGVQLYGATAGDVCMCDRCSTSRTLSRTAASAVRTTMTMLFAVTSAGGFFHISAPSGIRMS
jgi:hypothetical protein